jgi:signal peptidase II
MKPKSARRSGIFIIALLSALDFLSKWLILGSTGPAPLWGDYAELFPAFERFARLGKYLNIVLVWNTGVSFSLLSGSGEFNRWALVVLSLVIIRFIAHIIRDSDEALDIIGFSIVIAGALGNVCDRIRYGAVVDFIDFHVGRFHWPAFNLADTFICIGVALLIYRQLFKGK